MAIYIGCEGLPEDLLVSGIYFKSEKDITTHFAIIYEETKHEGNGLVKIYETEIPQGSAEAKKIKTGDECKIMIEACEYMFEIDLWGKYFFPKFGKLQMHYDERKYYGGKYDSDQIFAIAECFNFALAWGLQKAGIKPY